MSPVSPGADAIPSSMMTVGLHILISVARVAHVDLVPVANGIGSSVPLVDGE